MDGKKRLKQAEKALARSIARRSKGNVGGIKLLPTLFHGSETPVRNNNIPVKNVPSNGGKIDLDSLEDWE